MPFFKAPTLESKNDAQRKTEPKLAEAQDNTARGETARNRARVYTPRVWL